MIAIVLSVLLLCSLNLVSAGQGGCNAQSAIDKSTFKGLLNKINAAPFSSSKEKVLKTFVHANLTYGFSGDQIVDLLDSYSFSSNRNAVVKLISPWVLGLTSTEMGKILQAQSFSSDKMSTLAEFVNFVMDLKTENATIIKEFTFSSDKKAAKKLIDNAKPVSCVWGDVSFKKHIVFVVDKSGSMTTMMTDPNGRRVTRLAFVIDQLITILTKSLDSTQYFNLVSFSSGASAWKPGVVQATSSNIATAVQWAKSIRAGGSTNMYSALQLATNDPKAEGVVLLSDGEPNGSQQAMINLASVWSNGGTNILNTIVLEAGGQSQPKAASFMCRLANAGSGVCRTNN